MLITNETDSAREKIPVSGGEYSTKFTLGGSGEALPRGPTPYLFVYQFDRKGSPLVYPTTKLAVIQNHQIYD